MKSVQFTLFLTLVSLTVAADATQAQTRSGRTTRTQATSNVNPEHERIKTKAQEAYQQGKHQEAIDLAATVLRQRPRDHVALYLRGSAQVELGQQKGDGKMVRAGIADAREAIRLGAREHTVYYLPYLYGMTRLAMIESRKEHAETSISIADQVLALSGISRRDQAHLHYQRGMANVYLQDYDTAAKDYAEAIKLSPGLVGAYLGLAESHAAAGNAEKALAAYDEAVLSFPNDSMTYNNRGRYRQQQGMYEEALKDFNSALEITPEFTTALTNRGFTQLELKNFEEAEKDFSAALALAPQQAGTYSLRGTARLLAGRVQDAIADYTMVTRLDDRNAVAFADLGFARYFAEDFDAAAAAFQQAVTLNAELNYLAPWRLVAMQKSGRQDQIATVFESHLKKAADQRNWIDNLVVYLNGGLNAQELMKSVDKTSEYVTTAQTCEAHYFIGQQQLFNGNRDDAREHFKQAVASGKTNLSAYRGARLALNDLTTAATPGNGPAIVSPN